MKPALLVLVARFNGVQFGVVRSVTTTLIAGEEKQQAEVLVQSATGEPESITVNADDVLAYPTDLSEAISFLAKHGGLEWAGDQQTELCRKPVTPDAEAGAVAEKI